MNILTDIIHRGNHVITMTSAHHNCTRDSTSHHFLHEPVPSLEVNHHHRSLHYHQPPLSMPLLSPPHRPLSSTPPPAYDVTALRQRTFGRDAAKRTTKQDPLSSVFPSRGCGARSNHSKKSAKWREESSCTSLGRR